MPSLRLVFLALRRDLRAGELNLLLAALLLAVASLTSVGFFADRISRALDRDATQLLGGDLLLVADHPWAASVPEAARQRGLSIAESWAFPSMASTAEQAQLASIKAVGPAYPLRGTLRVADSALAPERTASSGPPTGEVWLDERLFGTLGVKKGDTVGLGRVKLRVGAMLRFESDRGSSAFGFGPRLMMNLADIPATGLIQVGSRVTYRLHLAGDAAAVADFARWVKPRLGRGESMESLDNARPELREMLDRGHRLLSLAALLAVILAAVAVGLSARRFVARHLDGCAVMRCFGATQGRLLQIYLGEFALLGLVAGLGGAALGLGLHLIIAAGMADLIDTPLPAPTLWPAVRGIAASFILLLGFALPPLLRLAKISTLRVLRREWDDWQPAGWAAWLAAAAALAGLMIWVAEDIRLGAWVAGGFAAALGVYALIARLAIGALASLRRLPGSTGGGWRYGLASLGRRAGGATVQVVALALGITAMLLLSVGHRDIIDGWRSKAPADAPNRFIVNIQQDQIAPLLKAFEREHLPAPTIWPMIRGRLVAINGVPLSPTRYADMQAQKLAEREFNLSYGSRLQAGNRVVAGQWHGDTPVPAVSVEAGVAKTLGLKLGDRLAFDVGGTRVEAPITSMRALDWDSMRVNFFVVAAPGVLDQQPTSYITSFYLPPAHSTLPLTLAHDFPTLTVIDISAILKQVQDTLGTLIGAVQRVFGLALVAGFIVMATALQATHDERAHELAILRTLGARNRQLRAALLAEFATLGAVAGVLGALGALGVAAVTSIKVLNVEFHPTLGAFALGALASLLGVVLAGWLGTRRVMRAAPLASLRALA